MSKRILESFNAIQEVGLAATFNGRESFVRYFDRAAFDVTLSNGVGFDGIFTVEGSHDKVTWFPLELSAVMALAGATGFIHLNVQVIEYVYLRPKITVNAGTGDITVIINASSLSN